jgi:hypothetical protein
MDLTLQSKYVDCLSVSKNQDTTLGCQEETHTTTKETHKSEMSEKIHQTCRNRKQAGQLLS